MKTIITTAFDSIYKNYDRTFSFLISSFIIFATFASILFGIHAGVLSKYEDPKFGEHGLYNWFNPTDIIRFPANQLKYAQTNNEPRAIDDYSSVANSDIAYSFVLDKTSSINVNVSQLETMKKNIVNRAENGLSIDEFDKFGLTDLIAYSMVCDVRKKKIALKNNDNAKAMIFCVDGNSTQVLKPISSADFEYMRILDKANFKNFVQLYIDFLGKQSKQTNQVTNLSQMFSDLDVKISSDSVKNNYHVITIISDFKNEVENNIVDILKKTKFAQKPFQLNLIRLKAKNDKENNSTKTLEKLHGLFSKTIFLYNIDIQDLTNDTLLVSLVEELSTPCSSEIRNIELFTPTVLSSSNGTVELEQLKNSFKQQGEQSDYIFTYINGDMNENPLNVKISHNDEEYSFTKKDRYEFVLNKDDKIDFIMSGNQDVKYPVIFDVYNKTKGYKQRIRFWIMPKLSKTVAQLHLILVTGAITSLTLYFFFFILFYGSPNFFKNIRKNGIWTYRNMKVIILVIILVRILCYCFFPIYPIKSKAEWYIVLEIISIHIISILIALYDENKNENVEKPKIRLTNTPQ